MADDEASEEVFLARDSLKISVLVATLTKIGRAYDYGRSGPKSPIILSKVGFHKYPSRPPSRVANPKVPPEIALGRLSPSSDVC